MYLTVNGKALDAHAGNLAALLDELDYADRLVATALNGEFVPKDERDAAMLSEGDKVEILAPMKGG
ncbi:sulfur carrier protein ThiS [Notoacmeibacter sp. MSK16QG-6]|uniref:sulfur carrier protein ThiS n=1 Tax=Notoacmeibacter sp. MSK16QG-6 TaxID=2957982 RepID=UPI00209D4647|nr:sulfur carrier protein ThiS [Notoacmeibacter sp. MSK16QG-6]MCP1200228.1 sulfur carrier protein ThiS [Notoacmeibacter sp. MSK16QG-6]